MPACVKWIFRFLCLWLTEVTGVVGLLLRDECSSPRSLLKYRFRVFEMRLLKLAYLGSKFLTSSSSRMIIRFFFTCPSLCIFLRLVVFPCCLSGEGYLLDWLETTRLYCCLLISACIWFEAALFDLTSELYGLFCELLSVIGVLFFREADGILLVSLAELMLALFWMVSDCNWFRLTDFKLEELMARGIWETYCPSTLSSSMISDYNELRVSSLEVFESLEIGELSFCKLEV